MRTPAQSVICEMGQRWHVPGRAGVKTKCVTGRDVLRSRCIARTAYTGYVAIPLGVAASSKAKGTVVKGTGKMWAEKKI